MNTLIVGGGLSGLAVANALEAKGHDYVLVEARQRFGGRIKTEHHGGGHFDLGPAWFWPGQPRIAALIGSLGLEKFDQFCDGISIYEDARGQVRRRAGFASMQGSWRLKGGLAGLTRALAYRVPAARKRVGAAVTSLVRDNQGINATLSSGDQVTARQIVLALPPRLAGEIAFAPALPEAALKTLRRVPTWMAGQAKAVAVYDRPFWRDAGLSGDANSERGPMVEIHDASPAKGGPYALFGFIGIAPQDRRNEDALRQQICAQLGRLFGPEAAEPLQVFVKDWAFDPHTSTQADTSPLYAHPSYGLPKALTQLWDARLHFAGSEVAPQFGGYIEGALEAAENAVVSLGVGE